MYAEPTFKAIQAGVGAEAEALRLALRLESKAGARLRDRTILAQMTTDALTMAENAN